MKRTAIKHGVPIDIIRLESNGQNKLLLKVGRLLLLQEPILTLQDEPKVRQVPGAVWGT